MTTPLNKYNSTISTNGNLNGISTISNNNLVNGTNNTISATGMLKAKYHILGEDVEISGYVDGTTAMMISTLNVLGKPFYDELKKNNVSFSNEIEEFLKEKFRILERDSKIDSILAK